MAALVWKELGVYFVSPMAYIVLTVYLLLSGFFFSNEVFMAAAIGGGTPHPLEFAATFQFISQLAILITPFVTMRLLAEERSRGTIELLMTAPVSDFQVVASKFLGAQLFFSFLLVPTLIYVAIVRGYTPVDWGATLTGYLGLLLFIALLVSMGLFISALTSSQLVAAVVTMVLMFCLFLISIFQRLTPPGSALWVTVRILNVAQRSSSFALGIVDTRDLVFFLGGTAFFLFATTLTMESRRWR
jgi:ABC-2 type transport system permease protein